MPGCPKPLFFNRPRPTAFVQANKLRASSVTDAFSDCGSIMLLKAAMQLLVKYRDLQLAVINGNRHICSSGQEDCIRKRNTHMPPPESTPAPSACASLWEV